MADEIRAEQLWQVAREMIRAGQAWKAREVLKTIFVAFPSHVAARVEFANILKADGDIDGALVHCSFAYQLNREFPGLAQQLGELYILTGFYEEARVCLEKVVRDGNSDKDITEKLELCREIARQRRNKSSDDIH